MAGIGFELRRLLKIDSYISLFTAYGYVGLITSGPWILAILTILALAFMARLQGVDSNTIQNFQIIIVYCIAGSLILSSLFQHSYTRYIADQFYLGRENQVIPSLNSIYSIVLLLSGVIGHILISILLPDESHIIKLLIASCFVILNLIWVTTSVLSGLLAYKTIFLAFFSNFFLIIILGYFLQVYGLIQLLISFLSGQFLLLMILIYMIYRLYPSKELINYNFFSRNNIKLPLFFTGFLYNIGIWIDKFIFWYHDKTGIAVIGYLHKSIVYDTPIFLAYLAIIPGAILFLLNMETRYSEAHESLYKKINGNSTFSEIDAAYKKLLRAGRNVIYSIIKAQSYIILFGITAGAGIFIWANISLVYFPLFCICLLAASLNVIFWVILDIIFYLDKIICALMLSLTFAFTNCIFTLFSIQLGVLYFGFGLVTSLFITVLIGFLALNRQFNGLIFKTFHQSNRIYRKIK